MEERNTQERRTQNKVVSGEDDLISNADDSLNIQERLVLELLDGERNRIEILTL